MCTMTLISLATVRRTKEMDCQITPIDSRLWFGADGRGAKGGVCVVGGSLVRLLVPLSPAAAAVPASAALDKGCS